jgi:hypothetical protein
VSIKSDASMEGRASGPPLHDQEAIAETEKWPCTEFVVS